MYETGKQTGIEVMAHGDFVGRLGALLYISGRDRKQPQGPLCWTACCVSGKFCSVLVLLK